MTLEIRRQGLAIPDGTREPRRSGGLPEHPFDVDPLRRRESRRPPGPLVLGEALQAVPLEPMHPVLHGAWRIAEQGRDGGTGEALGNQQQPVQAMIIARVGRTTDFVLETEDDGRVGQCERAHGESILLPPTMRKYL